jgi:type II secretory pathway component GspD/PulD (secretin)
VCGVRRAACACRVRSLSGRVLGAWCLVGAVVLAQAPARPGPQRPGQMPTLPLTQLDDRALAADLDNRAFTLTFAQPVPIKDLLLQLVRGTNLSIIPDPAIGGSFIGELKSVTVRQALTLILPPLGLDYGLDGGFIRVFKRQPETRLFDINYIATQRIADAAVGTVGVSRDAPFARVSSATSTDLFADLAKGVQTLLSDHATFNVDRKAGLLQVTDFPERLDRIGVYLDAVHDRVHRGVQIDARVVEVELSDEHATTLDWAAVSQTRDLTKVMAALGAQGKVTILASPRLFALNNEPAIVKTDSFTLSVTPQISADAVIMLSLSPILSTPSLNASDTLARVGDGQTIAISGFSREREVKETKNAGTKGGWFGRTTVVTRKRVELVILLTPTILTPAASS